MHKRTDDSGARRADFSEKAGVALVESTKVGVSAQPDRRLDDVMQTQAGLRKNRLQVLQCLRRLLRYIGL